MEEIMKLSQEDLKQIFNNMNVEELTTILDGVNEMTEELNKEMGFE